ncbi:MAG: hypothetical protein CFE33_09125 [Pseudorhodobacter sp. PARRP1]|nr:MAG: hypothetical protein CFE33_09125 [Pseudorhodobacter sp. PARRP1]
MDLLILGSLLLTGGLLALAGVFDGGDGKDDDAPPEQPRGTSGDDTLNGDDGILNGWGGHDVLTLGGTAEGHGNQGNDTLTAADESVAYGGVGEDQITAHDDSTAYGGAGRDIGYVDGHATVHGGAGNDSFGVYGTGSGYGDTGADYLHGHDTTTTYGGDGTDDVVAWDQSTGYGGDGADTMSAQNQGEVHGDGGNDLLETYGAQNDLPLTSALYGGAGDDLISRGAHLDGGDGNDWLAAGDSLYGGAGNDILSYGHDVMEGGDGNDLLYMGHTFSGGTASGGAGNDMFVVNAVGDSTRPIDVISDFTLGEDQLAILVPTFVPANLYPTAVSYEIHAHPDAGYTDVRVTLDIPPTGGANPIDYSGESVIRLMGVTDLTAEDVVYVMNNGETGSFGSVDDMQRALPETPNADQISTTHVYNGTIGDDSFTAASPSEQPSVAAWLGDGDDSFTAAGQAHFVNAGDGDDHYTGAAPDDSNPNAATDPVTNVHMGGGNDVLEIGQGQGRFYGDDGNDSFHTTATPDPAPSSGYLSNTILDGGTGDDSYVIGSGDTVIDDRSGTEDYTFVVSDDSLTAGHNTVYNYQPGEHLRIEIPADMAGEVRFVDQQAIEGSGLEGTAIYIGTQQIAFIDQYGSGATIGVRDGIDNVEVVRT